MWKRNKDFRDWEICILLLSNLVFLDRISYHIHYMSPSVVSAGTDFGYIVFKISFWRDSHRWKLIFSRTFENLTILYCISKFLMHLIRSRPMFIVRFLPEYLFILPTVKAMKSVSGWNVSICYHLNCFILLKDLKVLIVASSCVKIIFYNQKFEHLAPSI